jgi:sugar/nucleoside kinase (ribokinase family)
MFDVVGVGTNSVDEVLQLPADTATVAAAGKARIAERHFLCGGQTATLTVACAALGLTSRYVGAFGSDENGKFMRHALVSRGVDVTGTVNCDAPNRSAVILVDPSGCRTVLWHRSDRLRLLPPDVRPHFLEGRILHVDDDDPGIALWAARTARGAGTPVTSDLEHASETAEQLFSTVTYPIVEQHFPNRLIGETDPERGLRKLRRLNSGVLCMTLGELGSVALDGDRFYVAPAFSVRVVDNTGAGDIFRAGFIYGLLQKWSVPEILRFANAAAAVSCTRLGAIPSVPNVSDVEEMLGRAAV